jgi:hypothetical protein
MTPNQQLLPGDTVRMVTDDFLDGLIGEVKEIIVYPAGKLGILTVEAYKEYLVELQPNNEFPAEEYCVVENELEFLSR